MKTMLVETEEGRQRVYNSLILDSRHLGIFSNKLAVRIIGELAKHPLCAMDIAKNLKENEQNIYYHLKKMRDAGIVRLNGLEQRYGMSAKMFELVSPVIATKLYESAYEEKGVNGIRDPDIEKFLHPFVADGKLNAKIIVGAPIQHGKYEATARDGVYLIDLAMFLGRYIGSFNQYNYKLDTETNKADDLKDNLILIGGPKINTVTEMVINTAPIYFNSDKEWAITSTITGNVYNYDDDAVIVKFKNPFDKRKEILLLAGRRSRGLRSAVLAFTRHTHDIMKGNIENERLIAKVVRGVDKQGNGIVDSITFLE